jgi:hypothetical protein
LLSPGYSQNAGNIDNILKTIKSIEKFKHYTYKISIDSIAGISTHDDEIHLIGYFRKGQLKKIYFSNDRFTEQFEAQFYISDSSLIAVEENNYTLFRAGGPNWYKKTYDGKYYFQNDSLIYTALTGQSRFEEKHQDLKETLLKEYHIFKKILEELYNKH